MKKLSMILAFLLVLIAGQVIAEGLTATGYDTETVNREWEKNAFFSRMAELTGVSVTGHAITDGKDYQAMITDMLSGKQQADILFKAYLTREQEEALLDAGALVDLSDKIEANMPNLSALLNEHPEWREIIALDDGRIASLPLINLHERQVCVWLNKAWVEQCGQTMPATVEELTAVLSVILTGDPNGNGKRDEIPADIIGVYELRWLLPFFGVVADDYNLARDSEGQLVLAPELPGYRTFVETMKSWYFLGLMRDDTFTASHTALQLSATQNATSNTNETNTSGMIVSITPYTSVGVDEIMDYEAILLPDPSGNIRWRNLLGDVWTGTFAVTSQCPDVDAALRWVDALYGEAGAEIAYVGEENVDYRWNESGYWQYIVSEASEIENIRANSIIYTGVTIPGLYPADIIEKVDSEADVWVIEQSEKVHAVSERVLRNYYLPRAIRSEVETVSIALAEKVDVGIARFVTGELPLDDEHWNAWLQELHDAGSDRLIELLQNQ